MLKYAKMSLNRFKEEIENLENRLKREGKQLLRSNELLEIYNASKI